MTFRVAFVAGVAPDKWVRRWRDRRRDAVEVFLVADAEQTSVLHDGRADMALVRLPVEREGLHLIPLYEEVPVAVLPKDHLYADLDRVLIGDLEGEHRWDPTELPAKQAVGAVAAGTGFVVLPMSLARLHHRNDVVPVPVDGVPETRVGLAWRVENEDERVEAFIGIVRGRTANSSRGGSGGVTSPKAADAPRGNRRRTGNR